MSRVVTTIKEYIYHVHATHAVFAFAGADPEAPSARVDLCGRTGAAEVYCGTKTMPAPSQVSFEPIDCDITWLLNAIDRASHTVVFTIDRSQPRPLPPFQSPFHIPHFYRNIYALTALEVANTVRPSCSPGRRYPSHTYCIWITAHPQCKTPRRNEDVANALQLHAAVARWASKVRTHFDNHVVPFSGKNSRRLVPPGALPAGGNHPEHACVLARREQDPDDNRFVICDSCDLERPTIYFHCSNDCDFDLCVQCFSNGAVRFPHLIDPRSVGAVMFYPVSCLLCSRGRTLLAHDPTLSQPFFWDQTFSIPS